MPYTKNIHFNGSGAVLVMKKEGEKLEVIIKSTKGDLDTVFSSVADFPHVLIPEAKKTDFWDLVREEIISVGTRKQDNQMQCRLLQNIQKELHP